MKQRDKMRELFRLYGNDEASLIRKYAEAERRGEVERWRNKHNMSPEDYAKWLLHDARRHGWLKGFS